MAAAPQILIENPELPADYSAQPGSFQRYRFRNLFESADQRPDQHWNLQLRGVGMGQFRVPDDIFSSAGEHSVGTAETGEEFTDIGR